MSTIKAIKIDVEAKTITKIDIQPTLANFYKEIKTDIIEYVILLKAQPGRETQIAYVDEEGLNRKPLAPAFEWKQSRGTSIILLGNALIVGVNPQLGHETSTYLTVEDAQEHITFL